jgi:tetratricopeptide (TPR) repeat protein
MAGHFSRVLWVCGLGIVPSLAAAAVAGDGPKPPDAPASVKSAKDPSGKLSAADYGLPGEEPPRDFVPARPRSVEEQKRIEMLRAYATARALEDRRQFDEAIKTLQKSLTSDPESIPVLRRLSKINFALGRDAVAIGYCKRVIAADPGDIETIGMLVEHYQDDPAAAEGLLNAALANPKLARNSAGAVLLGFELGKLLEATLRFDKAADAYAAVVDAIDDKARVKLEASDIRRILGDDEAQAYLRFGRVFLQAKRTDRAIQAFERGLVYDPDQPFLLKYLAQTFEQAGRGEEALRYVERFINRRPSGRETYDLLARILTTLNREAEIIPRLEKYAEAEPKNDKLQLVLAEQYKAAGMIEKSDAILKTILVDQGGREVQDGVEAFPRLVKEHKTDEVVRLLAQISGRVKSPEAVKPLIGMVSSDPAYSDQVIDAGLKLLAANQLDPQDGWTVLLTLAYDARRPEKLVDLLRWQIRRQPNPRLYLELAYTQTDLAKYADAEATVRELTQKYPDERNARNQLLLSKIQGRAGRIDDAIASAREALRLEPNDPDSTQLLAIWLSQTGKVDEAIQAVRDVLKLDPTNPELNALIGSLLLQVNRNDEAIALFKGLLDRYPNNEELVKAARNALSGIYVNMGDLAKGEAELEILLAKNPDDIGVNNDLGYLYADQGKKLAQAESMIRKAVNEEPERSAYLDSLGWVLFKQGKFAEARLPLEKAADNPREPVDATILDHLGDVYFQLQERDKARAVWERATKVAGESKQTADTKRLPEIQKKLQSLKQLDLSPRPSTGNTP